MNNYGELRSYLAAKLNREDLTGRIPTFVRLAESDIYRTLRCRDNEFTVTFDQSSPAGSASVLPEHFLEMRGVFWNNLPLRHISFQRLQDERFNSRNAEPLVFSTHDRRLLIDGPVDDDPANWEATDTLELYFYGAESLTGAFPKWNTELNPVDALNAELTNVVPGASTDANQTRLLLRQPNLYLYGALHHAYDFLQQEVDADRWLAKFGQVMQAIEIATDEAELTGSTAIAESPYGDQL
ncbi:MAG: hypothetical protein AAGI72_24665 [Pseudomonadota bacterium]